MRQRIIKILFWITILAIIINVGTLFMQHSGQVLAIGWTPEEYDWIKENHQKHISIVSEINSPYIEAVIQKVQKMMGMEINIIRNNEELKHELTLKIIESETEIKGFIIPFASTQDDKYGVLVYDEENKDLYRIVKKTIEHINQTQELRKLKHEIDIQTSQQLCAELVEKAFNHKTTIRIGYDTRLYPLTYSVKGKASGVAIDELNTIFAILGIEAKYVPFNKNQSFDAIALVDQTYPLDKTNPYFLMDPVFVGHPFAHETVWINEYFPSFENVIQSNVFDIQFIPSTSQQIGGYVEDRRVYEANKMTGLHNNDEIISGRGNNSYEASLGITHLTENQIEAINYAIELAGTKEETLYETIVQQQQLTLIVCRCIVVFCILCTVTISIWRYKQRRSVLQVEQITQMVKVDKQTTKMLYAFADVLEGIDDDWYENNVSGHAARVSLFTECLVNEMKVSKSDKSEIIRAAIMHDVGKIEVDKGILLKKEVLTHEEFQRFQEHCEVGYEIAERCNLSDVVKNVAMYHHEQWDGEGYYGLKGEKIPIEARIVALADVYDSIRVERVYHPSYTHKEATEVILQESGSMLDPYLVEIFNKKQDEFEIIYRKNISL